MLSLMSARPAQAAGPADGLWAKAEAALARSPSRADLDAILVTHLPEDAARLADRAVILAGMPARIVGDVDLSPPRDQRSEADLASLARTITLSGQKELT